MAMSDARKAEFEKILPKARKKPVPYGLCLGKKPEDNTLILDIKKKPQVLMRTAKGEGETGKVTCGTLTLSGKILTLMIEHKMLPGLAKNMKMFMTKNNLKYKVVVVDPDGNELESEEDPEDLAAPEMAEIEEEADVEEADPTPETTDPLMGEWAKTSTALAPFVERFLASGHDKVPAIKQAWTGAMDAAEQSNYKTAMMVAAKIKPLVTADHAPKTAPEEETPEDPNRPKWESALPGFSKLYEKAMKTNPEERAQIDYLWIGATEKADAGGFTDALKNLAKLKPILDEVIARGGKGQDQDIPKDVVPFQKSRVLWVGVKSKMQKEMGELIKAIEDVCAGDPDLAAVSKEAKTLMDRLNVFDTQLEDTLDAITNTQPGADRDKLKEKAVAAISAYQTALGDSFFADVDSNNGFKQVSIAADATKSLQGIKQVLAA